MTQMHSIKQFIGVALLVGATVSCGDVSRQGQAPVYLVVNSLLAGAGGKNSFLESNVVSASNDLANVEFSVAMKNVLLAEPTTTTNNDVNIRRYHVSYRRADGRNSPGVDVPYGFDGAATVRIPAGATGTLIFEIVRQVAKAESPLAQLKGSIVVIATIADVTFYGTDQVGNDISVTASMQINFSAVAVAPPASPTP
jgi:hypothetical protein